MSKGDTFENDLIKLIFNGTPIAGIADNATSSPLASLYVSLHTADPNLTPETGTQSTSEIGYTGYARVAVARNGTGWVASGDHVNPAAPITFGQNTGVPAGTVSHFAVGTAVSGTGKLLYSGTVLPNIVVGTNVTPQLTVASQISED